MVKWLGENGAAAFDRDVGVSVFETNIRVLGRYVCMYAYLCVGVCIHMYVYNSALTCKNMPVSASESSIRVLGRYVCMYVCLCIYPQLHAEICQCLLLSRIYPHSECMPVSTSESNIPVFRMYMCVCMFVSVYIRIVLYDYRQEHVSVYF